MTLKPLLWIALIGFALLPFSFAQSRGLRKSAIPAPAPGEHGLKSVWSLEGESSGIVWDAAAGVLHAASGVLGVDIDASGAVTTQAPLAFSPNLRLAHVGGGNILLAFGTWSSAVTAFDLSGKRLWAYDAGAIDDAWPADLDGDGSDEVIVGFNGAVGLHVLDSNGRLRWKESSIANVWHVASADVRGSSSPEVLSTAATGRVYVFDADGTHRTELTPGVYATMVRAGKISASDAKATIFIVSNKSGGLASAVLVAISGDGLKKWSVDLPDVPSAYSMYLAPGKPWIAIGGQGGQVRVIDAEKGKIIAATSVEAVTPEIGWIGDRSAGNPLLVISSRSRLTAYRLAAEP